MTSVRLCVLIFVVTVALVEYGFVDAITREECKTSGCMKTVYYFGNTIAWNSDACSDFYHFSCDGYRDESISEERPENYDHTATSLEHQLKNLKFGSGVDCIWPNCRTRDEDIIAARYESSCSKQDESSNDSLKNFVDILNEANKIEKWTDMENWSVSRGLPSSFFKTYTASHDSVRYYEFKADADSPTYYMQLQQPVVPNLDPVILRDQLVKVLKDNDVQDVKYKQWISEPRTTVESHLHSLEVFVDRFCEQANALLTHAFIAKQQSKFFRWKKLLFPHLKNLDCLAIKALHALKARLSARKIDRRILPGCEDDFPESYAVSIPTAYILRPIDLRPDVTDFTPSDDGRVTTYVRLLREANLSHALSAKLWDGLQISRTLDRKLTEEHKKTNQDDHGLNFFRQRYTRNIGKDSSAVHWQHLWDCGVKFLFLDGKPVCEIASAQKFDWTSYFRDHYWGSVAVSGDLIPLLEHDLPEHWVVSPYLVMAISRSIQDYTNREMRNLILWRMAWQLIRHADGITKSTLRLHTSYYDCHSTFSNTIMRLQSRYNWYNRFPEHMRKQFYTMWADINFQMKYLRYKRLHEEGKDQDYEEMKSLLLLDYTNTEYYPEFPYASKYIEPIISIKNNQTNQTTLDIALDLQKVERSLQLQLTRMDYSYDDTYYLTETLGIRAPERFMEDRPASLNFGALGSAIGYNLLTRFIDPWRNSFNFFNNYKQCVEKNFFGFIGNNATKFYELTSIMFGLEAAWHAYEQHVALYDERNLKMPLGTTGEVSSGQITEYDNKQLFFASFGNSVCGGKHSGDLINVAVQMLPQFREAFRCETNQDDKWIDCQFD